MSRSYPIWNKVTACIYGSGKSFGAKQESNIEILVGSSSNNSHEFVKIATVKQETDTEIIFKFYIDNQKYKSMHFENTRGKAGQMLYTKFYPLNPNL
jgi:hypothetical protein